MHAQPDAASAAAPSANKLHTLTIYGYNYTNRYIDQFSVNGQGGSNLYLSTPTSSGGGGTCCIGWRDGRQLPIKVRVRWVADYCLAEAKNRYGESFTAVQHTFKEKEVEFNGPVPADPGYFEVHFYPDERVEVAITAMPSTPRLKLDPDRALPERPCEKATP